MNKATAQIISRASHLANAALRLDYDPTVKNAKRLVSGAPRKEIDFELAEQVLSDPANSIPRAAKILGVNRNTLYRRAATDLRFKQIFERAIRKRDAERKRLGVCSWCGLPLGGMHSHVKPTDAKPQSVRVNGWAFFANL